MESLREALDSLWDAEIPSVGELLFSFGGGIFLLPVLTKYH